MGDVHPMGNPHYWLDPANAVRIAIQIRNRLAQLRPADAGYFDQRLTTFKDPINNPNKGWLPQMAPFKGPKIITYHNSRPNFLLPFGLSVTGQDCLMPG